jgi:hypothetical protein
MRRLKSDVCLRSERCHIRLPLSGHIPDYDVHVDKLLPIGPSAEENIFVNKGRNIDVHPGDMYSFPGYSVQRYEATS